MVHKSSVVGRRLVDHQRAFSTLARHLQRHAAGITEDQGGPLDWQVGAKLQVDAAANHRREGAVVLVNNPRLQTGVIRIKQRQLDGVHPGTVNNIDLLNFSLYPPCPDVVVEGLIYLPESEADIERVAHRQCFSMDFAKVKLGLLPASSGQPMVDGGLFRETVAHDGGADFYIAIFHPFDGAGRRSYRIAERRRHH